MKMENNSKIIEEVLRNLNWELILSFYASEPSEEDYTKKHSKTTRLKPKTLQQIKKELKDLLLFVTQSNIRELHHEQWIIFWRSGDESSVNNTHTNLGSRLEVVFVPTRSVSHGNNAMPDDIHTAQDLDEIERDTLNVLLAKSLKEENYELCAVIHGRLKKLNKIKQPK